MSQTPVHAELQELLPGAALDILDEGEMEILRAHVAECPECDQLLYAYRQAAAAVALGAPRVPMDSHRAQSARARLVSRAQAGKVVSLSSSRKAFSMITQWSGWMVAAGLTGILLVHHSVHRPLAYGWLVSGLLVVLLLGLGIYAGVQRGRVTALETQLTNLALTEAHDDRNAL
jgi:anti-sigma factor RsiW